MLARDVKWRKAVNSKNTLKNSQKVLENSRRLIWPSTNIGNTTLEIEIEKLNILRPLLKTVTPQPLQITIKWDNFDILATGRSDIHCKIKETLLIRDLKPALNKNVDSEKLFLY